MKCETRRMLVDDNADILFTLSILIRNLTGATIECYHAPDLALAAFVSAIACSR